MLSIWSFSALNMKLKSGYKYKRKMDAGNCTEWLQKEKSIADVDTLPRRVHLWNHKISRTKPWRMMTITLPSRKTVLKQAILSYHVPIIPVARYPHRWKLSFHIAVRKICPSVLFLFAYATIQTDHNISPLSVKEHYGKQILIDPHSCIKFLTF